MQGFWYTPILFFYCELVVFRLNFFLGNMPKTVFAPARLLLGLGGTALPMSRNARKIWRWCPQSSFPWPRSGVQSIPANSVSSWDAARNSNCADEKWASLRLTYAESLPGRGGVVKVIHIFLFLGIIAWNQGWRCTKQDMLVLTSLFFWQYSWSSKKPGTLYLYSCGAPKSNRGQNTATNLSDFVGFVRFFIYAQGF